MCWFNAQPRLTTVLAGSVLLVTGLAACKPDIKETGAAIKYFDIIGYFTKDTARLNKLKKPVFKTVSHNGVTESKEVHIDNWGRELDLFIGSDINKPAWKNSYTVISNDNFLIYKAKYSDLHVVQMVIKLDKKKVKWILIYTRTKNILYKTTEKLTYYPDSLYLIEKHQKVRLMGKNDYRVQGVIGR